MNSKELANKTLTTIATIDDIYKNSPTARVILNNAPAILQGFKELQLANKAYEMRLKEIALARQNDLQKFKDLAPGMMENLRTILNSVLSLQATVRELAPEAMSNPGTATVIEYSNRQIERNLMLFQNITYQLLNS